MTNLDKLKDLLAELFMLNQTDLDFGVYRVMNANLGEKSNADLDVFFQRQGYNTKDREFAVIYVNGDNNLENLKRTDETWKVRRTEDEFKRLTCRIYEELRK